MRGKDGQSHAILEHMKKHGYITSMQAFKLYGATRISSIIFSLRKDYDIETVMVSTTNRYGEPTRYGRFIFKGDK